MTAERRPSEYFAPEVTPARADKVWAKVSAQRDVPSRGRAILRFAVAMATTLVFGLGLLFFFRRGGPHEVPLRGLSITAETASQEFQLVDGSRLELQPSTHVTVEPREAAEQRIVVHQGAVRFEVTHDPEHRFVVVVGDVEVIDVGTVFTVAREGAGGDLVRVSVERGDVEVRLGGREARPLHAGESLTTPEKSSASLPAAPPPEPEAAPSGDPASPPAHADAAAHPDPAASAAAKPVDPVTPQSLLAEATAARGAGNVAAEAQALETLRKRFPNDPRAPMAAFELGRIRMDQSGDDKGALNALRSAVELGPTASSREDAEARIVTLLAQSGDLVKCRAARAAFLAHYPTSVHRTAVQAACPPP